MPALTQNGCGRTGVRTVRVWDPLVRLIHWGVAFAILMNATVIEDDSSLHEIVGYTALALVMVRLLWGFIGTEHARFSAFPPNPRAALRHAAEMMQNHRKLYLSHNPLGALMAYNIWFTVILLAVTGYMMGTISFFGVEWVEDVHELAFNWLMASVVLHIGGVLLDTVRTKVRIMPAMIDGCKRIPEDRAVE